MSRKWILSLLAAAVALQFTAMLPTVALGAKDPTPSAVDDKSAPLVDLNTATAEELEALPGVGKATAKKIIAGRPYTSVEGLSDAGLSASQVKKIHDLVTVKTGTASSRTPSEAPTAAKSDKVDLNAASDKELEALPGVGAATAKKIIAGRPYKSVEDLAGAGLTAAQVSKIHDLVEVKADKAAVTTPDASAIAKGAKLDLNTATAAELEALPGIGPITSKKIIAGRPYKSVDDLLGAGLTKTQIAKFQDQVRVGAAKPAVTTPETPAAKTPTTPDAQAVAKGDKVDLNTATAKELESLPGVGPATSKKIIAGRPYKSVDDLVGAGVSKSELTKIESLVTVGKSESGSAGHESATQPIEARVPPEKGMVWVNTESKVYHKEGDRYYGKTKVGKFMTEADAIKAGYHETKQRTKTQTGDKDADSADMKDAK